MTKASLYYSDITQPTAYRLFSVTSKLYFCSFFINLSASAYFSARYPSTYLAPASFFLSILDGSNVLVLIFCISGTRFRGQLFHQRHPDFHFPRHLLQLLWGKPDAFPGQPMDIVPLACPELSHGPLLGRMCL
ncbi:hypothetical protein XENOCAPTIV_030160 [Xenoophorus captivus]|uniref:Uncharacterized protein n=1 Tax=Xenoophorus captivus TaxID=1517983 RepID=A0ABV0QYB0_9TELE